MVISPSHYIVRHERCQITINPCYDRLTRSFELYNHSGLPAIPHPSVLELHPSFNLMRTTTIRVGESYNAPYGIS